MEKSDNELIAEFYNGITFDKDGFCTDPKQKYYRRPGCFDPLKVEHLQYHKSWDWLMPVVEKIHSMDIQEFNYHVDNMTQFRKRREYVLSLPIHCPLDRLYKAVVEFIKWYNDTKQKEK